MSLVYGLELRYGDTAQGEIEMYWIWDYRREVWESLYVWRYPVPNLVSAMHSVCFNGKL